MVFSDDTIVNFFYWLIFCSGTLYFAVVIARRLACLKHREKDTIYFSSISNKAIQYFFILSTALVSLTCIFFIIVSITDSAQLDSIYFVGLMLSMAFLPRILNLQFIRFIDGKIIINHKKFRPEAIYKNSEGAFVSFRTASDAGLIVKVPMRFVQSQEAIGLLENSMIEEK